MKNKERMMLTMANNQVIKQEPKFITASEVAEMLGVSLTTGYRIVKQLNEELKQQGKITVAGKVSSRYFYEKVAL
ncbi:HTH domain-containing protein [Bacillota bacterium LX-D]|nr:HTH domain-containing protein [Bacillota bacterium LX-D]